MASAFEKWQESKSRLRDATFPSYIECWDAALEEAAKIAESDKTMDYGPHGEVWVETEAGSRIAAEIRELKEQK